MILGKCGKPSHGNGSNDMCDMRPASLRHRFAAIRNSRIEFHFPFFIFHLFELLPSKEISVLNVCFISQTQNAAAILSVRICEAAATAVTMVTILTARFSYAGQKYDTIRIFALHASHIVDTHTAHAPTRGRK